FPLYHTFGLLCFSSLLFFLSLSFSLSLPFTDTHTHTHTHTHCIYSNLERHTTVLHCQDFTLVNLLGLMFLCLVIYASLQRSKQTDTHTHTQKQANTHNHTHTSFFHAALRHRAVISTLSPCFFCLSLSPSLPLPFSYSPGQRKE